MSEKLVKIGIDFLYILSGVLIAQSIGHLRVASFTPYKTFAKIDSRKEPLHLGNAILGIIFLFLGVLILLLLKFELIISLNSLFVFIGFSLNVILTALWLDNVKY
ncbi:MAG: hypothetical protein ABSG94_07785 [Brevinematales bacterium]